MIVGMMRSVAEKSYKEDHPLNTLVMFDEAHRYAPPPRSDLPDEISDADQPARRLRARDP